MEDLEEISDTATENGKEEELDITLSDDEPEEGEISDDGEKRYYSDCFNNPMRSYVATELPLSLYPALNYPGNCPPLEPEITVERVVKPLSSEVVIYDDQGRTAIFTSPNKSDNWNVYQYSREPRMTNRNELLCKRKSRDYRDGTKHKRSKESKKSKRKSHHKSKSSDDKDRLRVKHRSPSSTSESDCSSCSSCSCSCSSTSSNSDVRLLGPKKTRGKENKQLSSRQSTSSGASHFHSYVEKHHHKRDATGRKSSTLHSSTNPEKLQSTPRKLTQSYSPPHRKEVTRQSPPIYGRMKHSRPIRSPIRSLRPQSREPKTPVKVTNNRSKSRGGKEKIGKSSSTKRKESVSGTSRKGNRSGRLPKAEVVDLTLGDTKIPPPPGSLGEMLLRKTKKGKLKVGRKVDKSTAKDSAKEIAGLLTNDIIISSEKIASVDGGDEEESLVLKDVVTVDLDQEDEDELQLRLIALKSSLKILNDVRREGRVATSEVGEAKDAYDKIGIVPDDVECSVLGAKMSSRNISKFEDTLLQCIFQRDAAGEFTELKEGHRIPNEEWGYELIKQEKAANKLIQDSFSNLRENAKDLSDSNQDIIDMEICDSSPEEDSFGVVDDVLKEVGEDIILDDDILIASHGDENKSQDGYQQNNFQIPVEWAYMMPPPPPPDQPDNDISNIHSWCYDQNMYLQSMQSTPCNSTDQVAPYDAVQQSHLDWSRNSQANESVAGCYDGDEDQARENVGQAESIFCQDQGFAENERDLTNGLLDLPKTTYSAVDNNENKVEETEEPEYSGQESLKDQAAHQYQAFMNAMLQNHSTQTCTANADRNLVEVNLVKSPSSMPAEQVSALEKGVQNMMNIVNNGRTLIKVSTMDKNKRTSMVGAEKAISTKAAARKRRKERKRLEKQKAKKKILIAQIKATVSDESESQAAHISLASSHEEEDEDLLRAQLLIDLSRKKLQKEEEEEKETSAILERSSVLVSERIAVKHRSPLLGNVAKKVDRVENSPHCSFPSSAESSPKIRPGSGSGYSLSRRKVLQRHTNGKEGSPTHVLRKDSRSLSDIGGYSLDPKNSRYDFTVIHDLNVRKDVPKFKFPPIKPVIINMDSDSSDDEDDVEGMAQAGCSTNDSPSTSSAGGNKGSFSSSLDSLLKGIRAKSSPNDPLPGKPSKREGSKAGVSNCPTSSTPNAVRHLSRTKQVEYHWLKEQLREKERLQRRLQQKKTTVGKKLKEAGSPSSGRSPSSANDEMHPVSSPCQSQDDPKRNSSSPVVGVESENDVHSCNDREVSLQEKGMIQIQLLNTSATADADPAAEVPEEAGRPGDDKSASVSEDEDDEEALRLMVLQTIPKKVTDKSNSEKVNQNNHIKSEVESLPTNIKIVIHQNSQGSNESLQENNEHKAMKEEPTSKENISEGEKLSQKDKRVVELQEEESSKAADAHLGDQLNKAISPIGENKELFSNVTNEHDIKETGKVTSDDDSKKELGSGQADDDRQREKQVEEEPYVKQSKPIVEIKKVAKKRVLTGSTSTQSKVVKKVEAAGQKGPVVQKDTPKVPKSVESNLKGVASGSKVISSNCKVISSNANGVSKKIVGSIISSAKSENFTEANDTKKSLALSEKNINEEKLKKINKDERQKRLDLLERLKKEYIKKRIHTNEVILQLAVLVQEATDEERQRQSLKQNINKLRLQLVGMEAQYEEQSGLLKTKMERIRKLQNQMTEDRQLIKRLETKGELLGKQVLGSDYTLPKVFDSPKRKQTLANNISALRQQMRDVYNKNKAKLQAATISAKVKATAIAPQVVGKQTDSSISSIQGKEGGASTVAINPKGNNKPAVKTLFQGETSSQASVNELGPASVGPAKRKAAAASKGPVVKKLAKSMSVKGLPVKEPSSAETVTGDTGAMPVQGNEQNCQTPSLEGRKKIDEMNELCPYDLLGRCNDDSCTYQHLGQQPRLKRPLSAALPYGPNVAKSAKIELKDEIVLKSESNPIQPFKSKGDSCQQEAGEIGTLEINNVGNVTMEREFLDKADNGDKLPCRGENNSVLDESKELSTDSTTTFVHTIITDSTTSFVHTTEDLSIQVGEDVTVNSMVVASGVSGTDCSDNGGEKCLTGGKAGLGEVYTAANDVESLKERGVFEAKSVVEDQLKESRCEFQSVSIGEVDGRDCVTSPSAEKSDVCRILGDPALADTGNSRDSIVCCDAKWVNPMDQGSKESSDTVNRSLLDADDDSVMQNVEVEETTERNKRPNRNASDSQPAASACEEVKQLGISASQKSYLDGVVITAPDENQLADEANECIKESGTKDKAVDNMVRGAGDHNESSDAKENELSIDDIAGCTEDGSQTREANETDGGGVSNEGQCTDNCDLLSYTKDRTLSATEDKSLCTEACDRFSEASESHDSDLIHDEPKETVSPSGLDDDGNDTNRVNDTPSEDLDTHSDISSADVEQCDSRVKSSGVGVRSRQTSRRRRRPCASSVVCRRGRSSSSSATVGEGASSQGKANKRGRVRQVSTRKRKARGRPLGGRRGAR